MYWSRIRFHGKTGSVRVEGNTAKECYKKAFSEARKQLRFVKNMGKYGYLTPNAIATFRIYGGDKMSDRFFVS